MRQLAEPKDAGMPFQAPAQANSVHSRLRLSPVPAPRP